ncbi:MAG TPA: CBS domain-containing protein [Vulgatibacteraceae bacterium]|nr:CBS domain-containing protein [Vulgatibacteraceae bacterium]
MLIRNVYRTTLFGCRADEPLTEVARRMADKDVGSLAVFDGEELTGLITERDLVRALAAGTDPGSETAAAHAATRVRTASLDEDSQDVAQRMLEAGVRHLPVEDGGRPVGMVSMRDLLALEVWTS